MSGLSIQESSSVEGEQVTQTTLRRKRKMKTIKLLLTTITCALAITSGASAWDWPGTFVPATTDNTVSANGGAWYVPVFAADDGMWSTDTCLDLNYFCSQGSWHENTPMLKTTVSGLTASSTYTAYIVFDKGSYNSGVCIVAGLDPNSMISFTGPMGDILNGYGGSDYGGTGRDFWVCSSLLGTVTGVMSVSAYVDDGDYGFSQGTRYIGIVLSETPAVPEPSSILVLASGLLGACGLMFKRRNG